MPPGGKLKEKTISNIESSTMLAYFACSYAKPSVTHGNDLTYNSIYP
jgi:hypothetical protein